MYVCMYINYKTKIKSFVSTIVSKITKSQP